MEAVLFLAYWWADLFLYRPPVESLTVPSKFVLLLLIAFSAVGSWFHNFGQHLL